MIRPELEALLHGALDNTLTVEERAELARILGESPEARERAAELSALAGLIESLGPADAPAGLVDHVLSQVSHHPHVIRHATFQRGVAVNKKILFGLAAAAAIVLAVITYNSNPPATVGTEATIGAAQRAQAPQIAASDVKLGDTSAQDVLQTAEWDEIMKDEDLRTALQDEGFRQELLKRDYRASLTDDALLRGIQTRQFAEQMAAAAVTRKLDESALMKSATSADLKAVYSNQAFMRGLRTNANFLRLFARQNIAAALAKKSFQAELKRNTIEQALTHRDLSSRLAAAAKVNTGARVTAEATKK
jgi:hypothetical protein